MKVPSKQQSKHGSKVKASLAQTQCGQYNYEVDLKFRYTLIFILVGIGNQKILVLFVPKLWKYHIKVLMLGLKDEGQCLAFWCTDRDRYFCVNHLSQFKCTMVQTLQYLNLENKQWGTLTLMRQFATLLDNIQYILFNQHS